MSSPAIRQWMVQCFQGFYTPRTLENAWQWGEDNIILRPEESQDFAGVWESTTTVYVRFMMEFVTGQFSENIKFLPGFEDCEWDEFIQMKSSQTGFTLAILIIIAYYAAVIRKNVLYSIDSREEARRISKSRLQPLLQDCPATRARISENEDDVSNLTLFLLGLVIYLIGSHSEGAFANKSCGLVVVDEADVHPEPMPGMPETIDLARDRLKASGGGKLILLSKPKTEASITAREHKGGTQHQCFVPCPHCNAFQVLVFERLRYDHCKDLAGEYDLQRVEAETFYECEVCHQPIRDRSTSRGCWKNMNGDRRTPSPSREKSPPTSPISIPLLKNRRGAN